METIGRCRYKVIVLDLIFFGMITGHINCRANRKGEQSRPVLKCLYHNRLSSAQGICMETIIARHGS